MASAASQLHRREELGRASSIYQHRVSGLAEGFRAIGLLITEVDAALVNAEVSGRGYARGGRPASFAVDIPGVLHVGGRQIPWSAFLGMWASAIEVLHDRQHPAVSVIVGNQPEPVVDVRGVRND